VTEAKRNTKTTYVASASSANERITQPAPESFSPRDQAKWERNTMPEQRQHGTGASPTSKPPAEASKRDN